MSIELLFKTQRSATQKGDTGSNGSKLKIAIAKTLKLHLRKRSGRSVVGRNGNLLQAENLYNLRNSRPKREIVPSHSEWLSKAKEIEDK